MGMAKMRKMVMVTMMTMYSLEECEVHTFFLIFTTKMVLDTSMSGVKTRKLKMAMKMMVARQSPRE
jgi:hypothetical protein